MGWIILAIAALIALEVKFGFVTKTIQFLGDTFIFLKDAAVAAFKAIKSVMTHGGLTTKVRGWFGGDKKKETNVIGLQGGSEEVLQDGPAYLHKGERVLSATENKALATSAKAKPTAPQNRLTGATLGATALKGAMANLHALSAVLQAVGGAGPGAPKAKQLGGKERDIVIHTTVQVDKDVLAKVVKKIQGEEASAALLGG